jgi:hypothetical protein
MAFDEAANRLSVLVPNLQDILEDPMELTAPSRSPANVPTKPAWILTATSKSIGASMETGSHSWTQGPAAAPWAGSGVCYHPLLSDMAKRETAFEHEHQKVQQTLIDFLYTELAIGPTFVKSALIAEDQGHMDHCARAKSYAIKAAETVRRFVNQVEDAHLKANIVDWLSELERLIATV